jgi:hypothetical protein
MSEDLGKHPIFWRPTSLIILPGMGRHIVFKCPRTGLNVQHWLADEPGDPVGATHESIICQACTNLHFINRSTGKLLGKDES